MRYVFFFIPHKLYFLQRFFGTIRQAGCANGHPSFITFLQLYRMLSVYKLLKPPKFGNCTQMQENSNANHSLSFNDFKNIFETNTRMREKSC